MNNAEYLAHLVRVNGLGACKEFCCVLVTGRDGVKVLWCQSHLVWLVIEASIPIHALLFIQKTFL